VVGWRNRVRLLLDGLLRRNGSTVVGLLIGMVDLLATFALGSGRPQHGAVCLDAVAVSVWDFVAVGELCCLLGSPGEVVSANFDVVVGEFSELIIVHAKQLGFLRGSQLEAGGNVDQVGDKG